LYQYSLEVLTVTKLTTFDVETKSGLYLLVFVIIYSRSVVLGWSIVADAFAVGIGRLKGGHPSSSVEQSPPASRHSSLTLILAVSLAASLAVNVIQFIVFVVRCVHASRQKVRVDDRQPDPVEEFPSPTRR